MAVTTINTDTFISDTVLMIRDELLNNITDPISATRPAGEKFVMTSYPQRTVTYPIITIQNTNISGIGRMGLSSEIHMVELPVEVRIWAKNVAQRDTLAQQVINQLRDFELDADGSVNGNLWNYSIESAVNVDDDGDAGVKSKVVGVRYKFILGQS
jgi:hypothetical protein